MKTASAIIVLALAACGGKSTPPPAKSEMGEMGEMHKMPPEIAKFHDTLAPRWHAEKGEKRMKDTCAAMVEFHANADALAKSPPPSGADATAWSSGTKELTDAVAALDATCKGNDATGFEPAFERVHKGFHGLMAAAGGHHEEGDEHEHKM